MIKFIQKQMSKDGFTLVELIIVIAVMAILAAIVVPRMGGITTTFKEKADERVAATVAREVQVMIQTGVLSDATTTTAKDISDAYETAGGDVIEDADIQSGSAFTIWQVADKDGIKFIYVVVDHAGDNEIDVFDKETHAKLKFVGEIK